MSSDDRLEILMNQAEELVQAKKYEEAIAVFEQTLRDFPQNAKAWRKYGHTLALRMVNRQEEAYIAFEKSLQIEPDNPITLGQYANALTSAGQLDQAWPFFEQSLKVKPDNPITLSQYANALTSAGQPIKLGSFLRDRYRFNLIIQ
jgi:cytochrome c-type biogenesis protein CcmH/NrfG